MAQSYPDIAGTRKQNLSRPEFLARDDANRSNFSGTAAPADPVPGQFWYNETSGWTYQWNGARWRLVADRFEADVWPEDYGATGDGSTSDKVALGNFFAAVNGGKTGRLRRGATYNAVDGYWVLNSSARIIGEGRDSVIKRTADVVRPVIDITANHGLVRDFRVTSTFSGTPAVNGESCPIRFQNGQNAQAENMVTDGRFYVGLTYDGVAAVMARNISAKGHRNRQIYIYQNCVDVRLAHLLMDGAESGSTPYGQYGLNINPGFGTASRMNASDIVAKNLTHHGLAVAARFSAWHLSNVLVENVTDSSGVGVLIEEANGYANQHGQLVNARASNCSFGLQMRKVFYIDVTNFQAVACGRGGYVLDSQYVSISNSLAHACSGNGWEFAATSSGLTARVDLSNVKAIVNGGKGFTSDSNCYNVRDIGCRGYANTGGDFDFNDVSHEAFARTAA